MNRKDVRRLILDIERLYPVDRWIHNEYHIWPILRLKLYMFLAWEYESVLPQKNIKIIYLFKKLIRSLYVLVKFTVSDIKNRNIYIGNSHNFSRVGDILYNRYFDILMDGDNRSIYLSKSPSKKGVYKPDRHLSFYNLLFGSKVLRFVSGLIPKQPYHIHEICNFLDKKGIDSEEFKTEALSFVRNVDLSMYLSKKILRKVKPEKIWVLCYYSADVLGLLIAAHKQSITTIDMQHGGQGKNHLAYCAWSKVPQNGYEALPDKFYTWDDQSAQEINQWAERTNKHRAIHFGNPWVEGWKRGEFEERSFNWPKNLILYTMQPIEVPVEDYLLKTIQQTKNDWNWWLRFHPRQEDQKKLIINRLKDFNIYNYVNIYDATELPLPAILKHTSVHITKYSGCTLEAQQFGVDTILIDEVGKDVFNTYLSSCDLVNGYFGKKSDELVLNIQQILSK